MKIRTGYSFRTAVGHLEDIISRLQETKSAVAPISDRMSTFGFVKWTKLAEKAKLRPLYGVELAVTEALGEKKPILDYWTFFAKDSLRPLHDLIGLATDNPGREPSLLYSQALAAKGLIKISGERLQLHSRLKPDKDFFVGLQPSTPKVLYDEAQKMGLRFLATGDNYFPRDGDIEFYRITLGGRANTQSYPQYILSDLEWREAVSWIADKKSQDQAIKNRDAAIRSCRAVLKHAELLVPKKTKTLRQMCIDGAKRTGTNLSDPVYAERLDRELKLIHDKNFEDYFFIIADMICWAKERMIVGPARGSSCGSLVCYLINITTIDPIPYNLIFERFIDTTREDLPDIDIDFSDTRRQLVFDYAEEKYGAERVARLGTVGLFKPRSALKATGVALRIPSWQVEKVLDGTIERSSGDARAFQALEDTLQGTEAGRKMLEEYPEAKIAGRLEGHPNNASQHAAGIVITKEPVTEYVAIDSRTKSAMCDKKDAESLNLLKIDALGLTQLSIFERTLELIGEKPISGWLEKLPIDDKMAFDVLNKCHFAGIFQFNGAAVKSLTTQIKVNDIEDIIALVALARPGPLATGGSQTWIRRRNGEEITETIHPLMEEVTRATFGCVIYQETVMTVCRRVGLMSWEDTAEIRRLMSKSMGDEYFSKYWERFVKGAKKNGLTAETAKEIWDQICTFGSFAFNRSHVVGYGYISYWCCWLKAHHPIEFAAATLDAESDPARQIALLRELRDEGIDYIAVDPELSTDKWVPGKRGKKKFLVGPLTMIKGFGSTTVAKILDSRTTGEELAPATKKKLASARTDIDTLFPVADAVKKLHPDLTEAGIFSAPTSVIEVQPGIAGEVMIIAVLRRIAPLDENETQRVLRRGGKTLSGPTKALNLFFQDDTDEIFCKINRYDYLRMGVEVFERGRAGKAIYAVKGTVPRDFRMISIKRIRYLGEIG